VGYMVIGVYDMITMYVLARADDGFRWLREGSTGRKRKVSRIRSLQVSPVSTSNRLAVEDYVLVRTCQLKEFEKRPQ
jgi:hypothetical protein